MSTPFDRDPSGNDPDPSLPDSNVPLPPIAQPPVHNPTSPMPPEQPPAYAGPPAYPPYYAPHYAPPRRTNGLAIASMVLGIVWIYWLGSILALIFGYVARKQIRDRQEGGDGMAIAGIVLGWVGVGVLVVGLVISFITYMSS
jgi:hypothetical protein